MVGGDGSRSTQLLVRHDVMALVLLQFVCSGHTRPWMTHILLKPQHQEFSHIVAASAPTPPSHTSAAPILTSMATIYQETTAMALLLTGGYGLRSLSVAACLDADSSRPVYEVQPPLLHSPAHACICQVFAALFGSVQVYSTYWGAF